MFNFSFRLQSIQTSMDLVVVVFFQVHNHGDAKAPAANFCVLSLSRDYLPLISLNKALLGPYFLGGLALGGYPQIPMSNAAILGGFPQPTIRIEHLACFQNSRYKSIWAKNTFCKNSRSTLYSILLEFYIIVVCFYTQRQMYIKSIIFYSKFLITVISHNFLHKSSIFSINWQCICFSNVTPTCSMYGIFTYIYQCYHKI